MKIVRFLLLILSVVLYCGCSSDTNEIIPEQPAPEDVYFVHYVITCTTNNPNSVKSINVTTGTGNHITQMPFGKESKWEATYGPFKKGQNAGISCSSEDMDDGSIFTGRIEVKKNDEPFVLKDDDYGTDILMNYAIN